MTQTVKLTDEQHARLAAYAKRAGLPVAEALEKLIPKEVAAPRKAAAPKATRAHPLDAKLRKSAVDEPISAAMQRQLKEARASLKRGEGVSVEQARRMLGL